MMMMIVLWSSLLLAPFRTAPHENVSKRVRERVCVYVFATCTVQYGAVG